MTRATASSPHISLARRCQIAELAEFIAEEYSPGNGPVEPERVLKEEGVTLSYGNYEDAFDGMLEHRSGRFHVYCNVARCLTATRKRFTLGHEIGHFFIDEHRELLRAGRVPCHPSFPLDSKNPAEREADSFAAALLAPEPRLRRAIGTAAPDMRSVLDAAQCLQVSPVVVAGRLLSLDVGLLAAVFWNSRGYRWKYLSETARRSRMLKSIEDVGDLHDDFPTAIALKEGASGFVHSAATTAESWFPNCRCSDILMEEAVALGEYGVLTLLRPCPS